MSRSLSLGLVVAGLALLFLGMQASESFSSDLSRFFTNSPTDKAIWLWLGGVLALVTGLFGVARERMRTA